MFSGLLERRFHVFSSDDALPQVAIYRRQFHCSLSKHFAVVLELKYAFPGCPMAFNDGRDCLGKKTFPSFDNGLWTVGKSKERECLFMYPRQVQCL